MRNGNAGGEPVLVVDDEQADLATFKTILLSLKIRDIVLCSNTTEARYLIENQKFRLVLLDLFLPEADGEELLRLLGKIQPDTPVIVVTGNEDIDSAVRCMKRNAYDYLVKPVEKSRLTASIRNALKMRWIDRENLALKQKLLDHSINQPEIFAGIVTQNRKMQDIFAYLEAIAPTAKQVLITGETGTGKGLLAQAIHRLSGVPGRLVQLNVAGIDPQMFADTLFGHRKGAFTGAVDNRDGMIAQAKGGTLFLDEIGDLSADLQVRLLQLLEQRRYYPLGSDVPLSTDAFIVLATHRRLEDAVNEGRFRRDLYYRIVAHHVHLPPLRERTEDLPLLLDHFTAFAAANHGRQYLRWPRELLLLLRNHDFPGNVRELEGLILDAAGQSKSATLSMEPFRQLLHSKMPAVTALSPDETRLRKEALFAMLDELPTFREAERLLTKEALKRSEGNQGIAAGLLGISRQALNRRIRKMEK